jgi:integrase
MRQPCNASSGIGALRQQWPTWLSPMTAAMTPDGIYKLVREYTESALGEKFGAHSMRSTVATNALANGADIAKVQDLLGHAPTYQRRASMITATHGRKTAPRLKSRIKRGSVQALGGRFLAGGQEYLPRWPCTM